MTMRPIERMDAPASQRRDQHATDRRLCLTGLPRSAVGRPLRFAGTGLAAGLLQLGVLALLLRAHWPELPANAVAFALAAQLNFALSSLFTWRDRRDGRPLRRRWLIFHGAILSMAIVNMIVFALADTMLPTVAASAVGIAAAAIGNFILGDRVVFRAPRASTRRDAGERERQAA